MKAPHPISNSVIAYNAAFLASFVLAGAGMYLLARTLTGRRDAAAIAGLVYAFTPYRVAHIAWGSSHTANVSAKSSSGWLCAYQWSRCCTKLLLYGFGV